MQYPGLNFVLGIIMLKSAGGTIMARRLRVTSVSSNCQLESCNNGTSNREIKTNEERSIELIAVYVHLLFEHRVVALDII